MLLHADFTDRNLSLILSAKSFKCQVHFLHIQIDEGHHAAGNKLLTLDLDFDLLFPCNKVDTLVKLINFKQPTWGAVLQ